MIKLQRGAWRKCRWGLRLVIHSSRFAEDMPGEDLDHLRTSQFDVLEMRHR